MPLNANLVNSRPTGRYKFHGAFASSGGTGTTTYNTTLGPIALGTQNAHLIVYATVSIDDGATTQATVTVDAPTVTYGSTAFPSSWKTFEYTVNEQDNFDAKGVRIMGWNVPVLSAGESSITFTNMSPLDEGTGWVVLIFIDNNPSEDSIDNRIVIGTMLQEGVASGMPAMTEVLTTHQVGLWTYGRANAASGIMTTSDIRPGNEGSANFIFTNLPTRASYYICICFHLTGQNEATGCGLFHHHKLGRTVQFAPDATEFIQSNGNYYWAGNDIEGDHFPAVALVGNNASNRVARADFENTFYTSLLSGPGGTDGVEIGYSIMEARKVPFDANLYLKVLGSNRDDNNTYYGFASLLVI